MKNLSRTLALIVAGMIAAASLASCAAGSASPLELTAQDNGSLKTLGAGQRVTITLDSNPTTGYRWDVDGALPAQLEQSGQPKFTSKSTLPGAGGVEVWTFVGKAAGTGMLKLKYWRSFEPAVAPVSTFGVTLDVQ